MSLRVVPMASQIAAAVSVALAGHSTGEQRKEAFHFLEQVKSSAQETWPECLRLFLAKDEFGPEARLAALQIVDEAIGNGSVQSFCGCEYGFHFPSGRPSHKRASPDPGCSADLSLSLALS